MRYVSFIGGKQEICIQLSVKQISLIQDILSRIIFNDLIPRSRSSSQAVIEAPPYLHWLRVCTERVFTAREAAALLW